MLRSWPALSPAHRAAARAGGPAARRPTAASESPGPGDAGAGGEAAHQAEATHILNGGSNMVNARVLSRQLIVGAAAVDPEKQPIYVNGDFALVPAPQHRSADSDGRGLAHRRRRRDRRASPIPCAQRIPVSSSWRAPR